MLTDQEKAEIKEAFKDLTRVMDLVSNRPKNPNLEPSRIPEFANLGLETVDAYLDIISSEFTRILLAPENLAVLDQDSQGQVKNLVTDWITYLKDKEYKKEEPIIEDYDINTPWQALNWAVDFFKACNFLDLDLDIINRAEAVINLHSPVGEAAGKRMRNYL